MIRILRRFLTVALIVSCYAALSQDAGGLSKLEGKGWRAISIGRDVSGWHGRAGKSNSWFSASSIRTI